MDSLYLDLRKAFDSVPHKRCVLKLERLSITGNLLRWIKNFLSERKQRVVLNGLLFNSPFYSPLPRWYQAARQLLKTRLDYPTGQI